MYFCSTAFGLASVPFSLRSVCLLLLNLVIFKVEQSIRQEVQSNEAKRH